MYIRALTIQRVSRAHLPWVNQTEREGDLSPSSGAKVKKERSLTSTPPYAFVTWTGTSLEDIR